MTTINLDTLKAQIAKQQKEASDIGSSVNAILQKAIAEKDEKRKLQFVAEAHESLRNAKKAVKQAENTASALSSVIEAIEAASG